MDRPEITFGSNVVVWKNKGGRSITIKPRRYKDSEGQWKDATSWNPSDIGGLVMCLQLAAEHCIHCRASEEKLNFEQGDQDPGPG